MKFKPEYTNNTAEIYDYGYGGMATSSSSEVTGHFVSIRVINGTPYVILT